MPNISKRYIDGLKPQSTAYIRWDNRVPGFGIRVYSSGKKSFVLRYSRTPGARPILTIGPYGPMTETQARRRAEQLVVEIRYGADPMAEREAKRIAVLPGTATFGMTVEKYINLHARPNQRTWKETERILKGNCAAWMQRPIASITRNDVQDLVDEFFMEGRRAKARVTGAWLRALFKWARNRGVDLAPMIENIQTATEPGIRDRVYTDDEVAAVWRAANELEGIESGFVKLILLLGVRKSELAGMRRGEFDDPDNPTVWTVPHERVKIRKSATKRRTYIVPLPPLAQRVLKSLPRFDTDLMFPANQLPMPATQNRAAFKPSTTLSKKVAKLSGVEGWTYHACRHTIATWLENEGHSEYERALVLNHTSGSVTAGYSHGYPVDLKRRLLEKWADHIAGIVQPEGVTLLA